MTFSFFSISSGNNGRAVLNEYGEITGVLTWLVECDENIDKENGVSHHFSGNKASRKFDKSKSKKRKTPMKTEPHQGDLSVRDIQNISKENGVSHYFSVILLRHAHTEKDPSQNTSNWVSSDEGHL